MGKKVYPDTRSHAERASVLPERPPTGGGLGNTRMLSMPRPTAAEREDARRYMRKRGHADLFDVLGLE
jgi:hypothetical protein